MSNKNCVCCGKELAPVQQYGDVNQVMCWACWRDLCEEETRSETEARALRDLLYVLDEVVK